MPLPERKCHTRKCKNTFLAKDGHRQFCDSCLLAHRAARARKYSKRPEQRKYKNEYLKRYRRANLELIRAYKAEWQRRKRAGLPTRGIKLSSDGQKPSYGANLSFRRCPNCAFWLDKGQQDCPRCGSENN